MKFTIIIPTYNMEKYINKALSSLSKQTFQNFEVIIVDDGSNDNTEQIVKPFLRHSNYKYFKKVNGNGGSVINYVIKNKLIKVDYVSILDSDDGFNERALEIVERHVRKNPNIDMIISKMILHFTKKSDFKAPVILFKSKYVKANQVRTPLSSPQGKFYRKDLFIKLTPLREHVSYQDIILYHELVSKAQCIYYINKALAIWGIDRPNNSSQITGNEHRVNLGLDNLEALNTANKQDSEIVAYSLMYLWELKRHIDYIPRRKIKLNTKNIKFKWFPGYIRMLVPIKTYFKFTTRHFVDKSSD